MAISTKVITMRQGNKADYQASKMLAGELAVINDTEELHFSPKSGKSIRVATEEDLKAIGGKVVVDEILSETSTNPVQNKVVTAKFNQLSEQIEDLKENGTGGGGLSETSINLLITVLKNCLTTTNQTSNIDALEVSLKSGGGSSGGNTGGGDDSGDDNTGSDTTGITQTGSILAITGGVTATQTGSVLAIA